MSKICFFISSAIELYNDHPLYYSKEVPRTAFTVEERLRQTVFTITSIKTLCPGAKIFLFDISKNYQPFVAALAKIKNVDLEFIACEEIASAAAELCRTHPSKGLCEATSTALFLQHRAEQVKEFDYLIKVSGRYFFTNLDTTMLTAHNTDMLFVKGIKTYSYDQNWGWPSEIVVSEQLLHCPTHMYAIGSKCIDRFREQLASIIALYVKYEKQAPWVDYECAFAYYVVQHSDNLYIPWTCGGWTSSQGEYIEW